MCIVENHFDNDVGKSNLKTGLHTSCDQPREEHGICGADDSPGDGFGDMSVDNAHTGFLSQGE